MLRLPPLYQRSEKAQEKSNLNENFGSSKSKQLFGNASDTHNKRKAGCASCGRELAGCRAATRRPTSCGQAMRSLAAKREPRDLALCSKQIYLFLFLIFILIIILRPLTTYMLKELWITHSLCPKIIVSCDLRMHENLLNEHEPNQLNDFIFRPKERFIWYRKIQRI